MFVSVPYHNLRVVLRDLWPRRLPTGNDLRNGQPASQRFYQWRLTPAELRRELEVHGFAVRDVTPIARLTGAGRLLRSDLRLFTKRRSRAYNAACRLLALAPSSFISHMICAVAVRR